MTSAATPAAVQLKGMSRSDSSAAAACEPRNSATERRNPSASGLRIRRSVQTAPAIIAPTAMGRTSSAQTTLLTALQSAPDAAIRPVSANSGLKNRTAGIMNHQANTPPEKQIADKRNPMMYPTPRYAGDAAGVENGRMPGCAAAPNEVEPTASVPRNEP